MDFCRPSMQKKICFTIVLSLLAASRLQNRLSELGRPESEINAARQIVKDAAYKVKNVHKRFGAQVVTLDSSKNPNALASTLKEILSDTIEMGKKPDSPEPPTASSAPAVVISTTCPMTVSSVPASLSTPATLIDEPPVGDAPEIVMKEDEL